MKKLVILLIPMTINAFALSPLDATLANAKSEAISIKNTCILTPPVTSPQIIWCNSHYSTYVNYLKVLQAPMPLTINLGTDGYVSPYAWSPYDICMYEPGRLINEGIC